MHSHLFSYTFIFYFLLFKILSLHPFREPAKINILKKKIVINIQNIEKRKKATFERCEKDIIYINVYYHL